MEDFIDHPRLARGVDALGDVVQRNVEPLHAQPLHPGVMLEERVHAARRIVIHHALRQDVRVHAEAEYNVVALALPHHLLVSPFLRVRQVLPPAIALRVAPSVVLDVAHAAVAIHQEVQFELCQAKNLRQVLLRCPHPALGPAELEPGMLAFRQRFRERALLGGQSYPEVLTEVTADDVILGRNHTPRQLEPRRHTRLALLLPASDDQRVVPFLRHPCRYGEPPGLKNLGGKRVASFKEHPSVQLNRDGALRGVIIIAPFQMHKQRPRRPALERERHLHRRMGTRWQSIDIVHLLPVNIRAEQVFGDALEVRAGEMRQCLWPWLCSRCRQTEGQARYA